MVKITYNAGFYKHFITLLNTISKLTEDGAEEQKHVGAFVIYFNILIYIHICICYSISSEIQARILSGNRCYYAYGKLMK